MENILSALLLGEKNKKETEQSLLEYFSRHFISHEDLKEGERIIYKGNSGKLIKKGNVKSLIGWERMGYMNTYKENEVYNIEFFKKPENYFE